MGGTWGTRSPAVHASLLICGPRAPCCASLNARAPEADRPNGPCGDRRRKCQAVSKRGHEFLMSGLVAMGPCTFTAHITAVGHCVTGSPRKGVESIGSIRFRILLRNLSSRLVNKPKLARDCRWLLDRASASCARRDLPSLPSPERPLGARLPERGDRFASRHRNLYEPGSGDAL
jgi:hypothetical protein